MSTVFIAHVKLSWGKAADYLIANDVEPGLAERWDQGDQNWNAVMVRALINVPVAPYLKSNRVTPPIATGIITSLTAVEAGSATDQLLRTRSQFIMAEIWQRQDVTVNTTFLHHDHPKWSQRQIHADVDYWVNHRRHPLITLITKWRIQLQLARIRKESRQK